MKPKINETKLEGKWIRQDDKIISDEVCERVEWLIENYLHKVASDSSGWDHLYVDLEDGRYWELFYPMGEMHGGGPPTLQVISRKGAKEKYGI